jgi:hypothetical protein
MPANLDRLVYTAHWYDGLTLVKKKWCSYNVDFINLQRGKYGTGPLRFLRAFRYGEKAIRQCFVDQLSTIRSEGYENIGPYPCVIGEIGIPYDMDGDKKDDDDKAASTFVFNLLSWWNWFIALFSTKMTTNAILTPTSSQNRAMDANFNALEKNLLNYTLWHYMPDNSAQWGDLWNGEDLSIWQQSSSIIISKQPSASYFSLEKVPTALSASNSFGTEKTLVTPSNKKKDSYPDRLSNSSTDSLQGLLPQQPANDRDLICLYRPHPHITSGTPIDIDFISPTEKLAASFKYTMEYQLESSGSTEIHVPSRFFPIPSEGTTTVTTSVGEWSVKLIQEHYWILEWTINETEGAQNAELKLAGITV